MSYDLMTTLRTWAWLDLWRCTFHVKAVECYHTTGIHTDRETDRHTDRCHRNYHHAASRVV